MKYYVLIFTVFIFFQSFFLQEKFTLSGVVSDSENGEELFNAHVKVRNTSNGCATNVYGFYSLTLEKGQYEIEYSYVGYAAVVKNIDLSKNLRMNVELGMFQELQEVYVEGRKSSKELRSTSMGKEELSIEKIKSLPALMGEVDIIKSLSLLPGVKTIGEGSTGFFVRGGNVDQNLILLDEANIYNASHLMGFFSVFNASSIKNVTLYKGNIPARYGGRLASVLDVKMKEGNMKRFGFDGGIGAIFSRLTIETPIVKDKGSIMIAARRSYVDVFLKLSADENVKNNQLYYYDLNLKANYKLGKNDRLFASGYFGRDVLKNGDVFGVGWGNRSFTLRWNHVFNDKLFLNTSYINSLYSYNLGTNFSDDSDDGDKVEWNSQIQENNLKANFNYYLNPKNTIKFGVHTMLRKNDPGEFEMNVNNEKSSTKIPYTNALESAIYVSNEQSITSKLKVKYGLRYSLFQNIGKTKVFKVNEKTYEIEDTLNYKKGEIYNTYGGLEPRLGVAYSLNDETSIKASYNRNRQYIQLASNAAFTSPFDVYFSASPYVKPQISDQFSIGYFRNFKNGDIETSAEIYYKNMQNTIDFKNYANLMMNDKLEADLRFGTSYAYGLELMVKKQIGKLSGWVSYTYSRVFKKIIGINNDAEYPARYDQPHALSIVGVYKLSKRIDLSATFIYNTGRAVTLPVSKFIYQGKAYVNYSARNAERLPDYHRLDLAMTLRSRKNDDRRLKTEWVFSIYNAYNRANAFSIRFKRDDNDPTIMKSTLIYLFGIIPSATFNVKF